jgi:hypothetical protein
MQADDSLQLDDSDEERAPDRRYVRSLASGGPVYELDVGPLHWAVHEAYDEDEGFECHWHKVTAAQLEGEDAAAQAAWAEAAIERALLLLQAWQAHRHPLLLRCAQTLLARQRQLRASAARHVAASQARVLVQRR